MRFRVLRPHAQGGIGKVSVAFDAELQREVALKQIKPERADDADSRARFLLEAEVTGRLEHPGIVPVYGLGVDLQGRPFYAMRFVRGKSLEEAIRHYHRPDADSPRNARARALELRSLLDRFADVCHTIAYAHSRGVLHRDLKPANILLGPFNESLVVDWGLAKVLGRSAVPEKDLPPNTFQSPTNTRKTRAIPMRPIGMAAGEEQPARTDDAAPLGLSSSTDTQAGTAFGTPAFMSPEQAEGRLDQLGPASDVYSLGAVLYTLLCGKAPFEYVWCDVTALIDRVRLGEFPPPRKVNARVPRELEAVCLKAMAMRPEDRYASATDLALEIERWLADEPVACYREPAPARLARWGRRHKPVVAGAAALLLTAVAALVGGNRPGRPRAAQYRRLSGGRPCTSASWSPRKPNHSAAATRSAASTSRIANTSMTTSPWPTSSWTTARPTSRNGNGSTPTGWGTRSSRPSRARARVETSGRWRFHPTARFWPAAPGPGVTWATGRPASCSCARSRPVAEVFALRGLTGAVQALAFSPDGRRLAAAWGFTGKDQGAVLAVFDIPGGRKVWEKPERGAQILSLAYSPDGRSIASGCGSFTEPAPIGFARLRDAATGEPIGPRSPAGPAVCSAWRFHQTAASSRWPAATSPTSATCQSPRRPIVHRLRGHANFIYCGRLFAGRPERGHGRLGQDHPALGPRRPARNFKPCSAIAASSGAWRFRPTAPSSSREAKTRACGGGTWPAAGKTPRFTGTPALSIAWPLAPTALWPHREARTAPSSSGRRRRPIPR